MSKLDQVIDYTQLFQDVELAGAMNELKNNPSELATFLQNQQASVYSSIIKQKDDTIKKVYGDLGNATKVQESILQWDTRNKELANIQQQVYENQKNSADAVLEDKQMSGRKTEMNEWSVNNKKDTLFVFSSLFIMLSALLLLTVAWRMGLISAYLWASLGAPLILIFVLIVLNRSQYTDSVRNQHYWNKRVFNKEGKIPLPSCPGLMDGITQGMNNIQQSAQQGMNQLQQQAANAMQQGANAMQ